MTTAKKTITISDLIAQCDQILESLSGYYSGNPDLAAATKALTTLEKNLFSLDGKIGKLLPYYSRSRIGYMGWSKRHVSNAVMQIRIGSGYNARSQLLSARESLMKLDRALADALT